MICGVMLICSRRQCFIVHSSTKYSRIVFGRCGIFSPSLVANSALFGIVTCHSCLFLFLIGGCNSVSPLKLLQLLHLHASVHACFNCKHLHFTIYCCISRRYWLAMRLITFVILSAIAMYLRRSNGRWRICAAMALLVSATSATS